MDSWEKIVLDACCQCRSLSADYYYNEDGDLVSSCDNCIYAERDWDD